MLTHLSCLEYGKLHGSVFAMTFARSSLEIRLVCGVLTALALIHSNLLLIVGCVRGLKVSEITTFFFFFTHTVKIRNAHQGPVVFCQKAVKLQFELTK